MSSAACPSSSGGGKYFLRQSVPGPAPFAARYLLERWPADEHVDASCRSFTYDEQFVRARDARYSSGLRTERLGRLLLAVYPLLGFLWADTKKRLVPCGFVSRSITSTSIFTAFCLLILQGALLFVHSGLLSLSLGQLDLLPWPWFLLDYLLFAFTLTDLALRFDQHLKDVEDPWGYGEWLTVLFRRKAARGGP